MSSTASKGDPLTLNTLSARFYSALFADQIAVIGNKLGVNT